MESCETITKINHFITRLPLWVYFIPYIGHIFSTKILASHFGKVKSQQPLYDVIVSNTSDYSKYRNVPNILISFIFLFAILPLVITPNKAFFTSLFKYASILLFIRSITTLVTILPAQSKNCENRKSWMTYLNGHCIDKIFSGHTSLSLLVVLLYYKYSILPRRWIHLLFCIQIMAAYCLILTRSHYTVDVIVAYMITIFVYLILHL